MPRRRQDPWQQRAEQLRREREAERRRQEQPPPAPAPAAAAPPAPTAPEPEPVAAAEPPAGAAPAPAPFDVEAWRANCAVTSLMRQKFGPNWARDPQLHRMAERALADAQGRGNGKALNSLRRYRSSGTYLSALEAKYGPQR